MLCIYTILTGNCQRRKNMSQKVERYRNSAWTLLESMPASCMYHSHELRHYSRNRKTYFDFDFALAMYGYNYAFTVAVNQITAKAEIVDKDGNDITELARSWCLDDAIYTGYLSA